MKNTKITTAIPKSNSLASNPRITNWLVFLLFCLITFRSFSQSEHDIPHGINTPGGIFDTLFDRVGQKYALSELDTRSSKPIGGTSSVNAVPTQTCQAGYFTLYFAPGTIFTNSIAAQSVLCQVFADVSTLINSTCPAGAIKIYCTNTPTGVTARGVALPFMSFPINPINANQGIIDNQVYKYLITGINPYATLPLIINSSSFYYHGAMQMNPTASWNFNMTTTSISGSDYDAYSVMLHEVIHTLGFYSLITANGTSFFGSSNNYYSRYDQYLYDGAGNKLIVSSSATSCPSNNLSFALSPTVLSTATTGCNADVTSPCSIAVQYSSANVNVPVYTPNCFDDGSSLSHFEDMCSINNATTDLGCASTTVSPSLNNNYYFVMANAQGTGSCFVKRHPKPAERWVLCDMGYSVNTVYSSTVAGGSYTYTGGSCSGNNIWGINDGIVNNVYTFTAITMFTNAISVPITSSILANDSPNTTTLSCLDLILGNVTWTVTGTNLVITANAGFSGPVIFRYMPKGSGSSSLTSSFGGLTYIFAYFIPGNCPPNSCDMVANGGFESFANVPPFYGCGQYLVTNYNIIDCWIPHTPSPDIYRRNCASGFSLNLSAPAETHNGAPNNAIVGAQTNPLGSESIMNNLSAPLVPGQVYNLSFFAYHAAPNATYAPFVVSVYSAPQYIAGASYSLISHFTLMPVNTWTVCSTTFTFGGAINHNAIVLVGNYPGSVSSGGSPYLFSGDNIFFDDVSITSTTLPTFNIPNATICGNTTFTDLAQYASAIPGTFTGSFVTAVTNSAGTQYNFNSAQTATPGVYTIAFNYTLSGCAKSLYQSVVVAPASTVAVSGTTHVCINSPAPVTLTASLSCGSCPKIYHWKPGNLFGATQTFSPLANTVYSVLAYNGTCQATQTIAVNFVAPSLSLTPNPATICAGSSSTLNATGNFTAGVWLPGSNSNPYLASPTTTSTYSFVATNSLGCTATSIISLPVLASPSISIVTNTACGYPTTLIATGTFSNVLWQPGGSVSPSIALTPPTAPDGVPYTVTGTLNSVCTTTQSVTVFPTFTSCCNPPGVPSFTESTICGTCSPAFLGPLLIPNSFTLLAGATLFMTGEMLIAPNTSITVQSGAHLLLTGAHLYSCSDMWRGIVVESGGKVSATTYTGTGNLVEDAEVAISISNYTASTATILDIDNTVFNRNLVSVAVSSYTVGSSNAFQFDDCVFTCRNFTFTGTSWPQAGTASPNLRFANNPTTGLAPPYDLQNAPVVNLKMPNTTRHSNMAFDINTVGVTSGTSYPTGFTGFTVAPATASGFILFDAHENFIKAVNSNMKLVNCVFQNTQTFSVNGTPTVGVAVTHSTGIVHNFKLDMEAASYSVGTRFYDCHRAIQGENIFDFRLGGAIFRSNHSQSTALTSASVTDVGQQAVFINTKQADNYIIEKNEFTNIHSAVTINFYPGPVNANMNIAYGSLSSWPQTTYINKVSISKNTICPELNTAFTGSTSKYVRNGVVITGPASHYIYTACGCNTIIVNDNAMYRVINGVRMDGINSYTMSCRNSGIGKSIASNTITLEEDFASLPQKGVEFTNSQSYPVQPMLGQKVQTIEDNILSVYSGTAALSNQNITLMHLQNNGSLNGSGQIYPSPHVLCNDLKYANRGFVFSGPNLPASWKGNKMEDLRRGMSLVSSATLGVQGNSLNPIDNRWNGSWSTYTQTFVDASSDAVNTKIWVQNSSVFLPSNNFGPAAGQTYGQTGNINIVSSGSYNCGTDSYSMVPAPLPNFGGSQSAEHIYINKTFYYRFLAVNDSLRTTDTDLSDFYTDLESGSIGKFTQVELYINQGLYDDAESILTGMDQNDFIAPETSYYNFYTLYLKYQKAEDPLSPDDVDALYEIADLCPDENGQAVYQARALWQMVTGQVYNEGNGCTVGGRSGPGALQEENVKAKVTKTWDVDLFPNPTDHRLTIVSKNESEQLKIEIKDLSNRLVLKGEVKTSEFFANLEFNLINGAYFITIRNSRNETVTKKLLIAK